jgi:hypothetical protein
MKRSEDSSGPATRPAQPPSHADRRRAIARRVADAHAALGDASLMGLVSGSVVDDLADELSDVDMSVVFERLPAVGVLQAACRAAGAGPVPPGRSPPAATGAELSAAGSDSPWFWHLGDAAEGSLVVAFHIDGIEVQIGYSTHAALQAEIDELLLNHQPDTPNHKLAEGLAKAEALVGPERLLALQQRLAHFPPELGRAMVVFWLAPPTPWRALSQLLHRDAALWCRELMVEACYRLLGMLAGLNRVWFTRFQLKRMHQLAGSFAIAPPQLADRIEALLQAPPREGLQQLHALEAEVLALVAQHAPEVDIGTAQRRQADFRPG